MSKLSNSMAVSIMASRDPELPSRIIHRSGYKRTTTRSVKTKPLWKILVRARQRNLGSSRVADLARVHLRDSVRMLSSKERSSDSMPLVTCVSSLARHSREVEVTMQLEGRPMRSSATPRVPRVRSALVVDARGSQGSRGARGASPPEGRCVLEDRACRPRDLALRAASEEKLASEGRRSLLATARLRVQRSRSVARESRMARFSCIRMPCNTVELTTCWIM
mmetsp:Transcript_99/g.367  ORF Transcript_99/g.367 Transcript_99/m.367 type:complete len:222 (-) Transcript_99:556-1221(-)